jgi:lysophospholipase L1-like esterase
MTSRSTPPPSSALRRGGLAVALIAVATLFGCGTPAQEEPRATTQAEDPAPLNYVALGDSYASGYGAGSYSDECGRSPLGLPGLLGSEEQITLVADATCAGARAASVAGGPIDLPEQVAGVVDAGDLSGDTSLVTISAGGNDAGFGEVVAACAIEPPAVCEQVIETQNESVFPVLERDLAELYGAIRSAAPDAAVLVTGYPHLFSPDLGDSVLPRESQEAFNAGTDALNSLVRGQAEAYDFTFIDLVAPFEGHGLGSSDSWITYQENAPDNLHPTAEGYRSGYLAAVRDSMDLGLPR